MGLVILFYYAENIKIFKTHVKVSLSLFYAILTLITPYLKFYNLVQAFFFIPLTQLIRFS